MKGYFKALILILVCLSVLIPFASSDPDGLEKVAKTLGVEENESSSAGIMPDYTVPVVENESVSTFIAGVVGVFLVLGAAFVLGKSMRKPAKR
jgi:PDZ domain-containing secreted protein